MNRSVRGRVELVVGRLGSGKTSWAGIRVRELALQTKRPIACTGIDWGDDWTSITSMEDLDALRDHVLLWDEVHLWAPSSRGSLGSKEHEMALLRVLSLARKRGLCVVGTTQAYTRVATHVRQLVTSVWTPRAVLPGRLHKVSWDTPPEDGSDAIGIDRWYRPARGRIPTTAEVWLPPSLWGDDAPQGSTSTTVETMLPRTRGLALPPSNLAS